MSMALSLDVGCGCCSCGGGGECSSVTDDYTVKPAGALTSPLDSGEDYLSIVDGAAIVGSGPPNNALMLEDSELVTAPVPLCCHDALAVTVHNIFVGPTWQLQTTADGGHAIRVVYVADFDGLILVFLDDDELDPVYFAAFPFVSDASVTVYLNADGTRAALSWLGDMPPTQGEWFPVVGFDGWVGSELSVQLGDSSIYTGYSATCNAFPDVEEWTPPV